MQHLLLRGIPQIIVGLGIFQLLAGVSDRTLVVRMLGQRAMRPIGRALMES